jgi:MFS family permease
LNFLAVGFDLARIRYQIQFPAAPLHARDGGIDHLPHRALKVFPLMRFILGFLSGVIGLLAGWFGLALLVIGLAGTGHDGGGAMGAFFMIGPIGGLVGFVAGVLLFVKIGIVSQDASSPDAERSDVAPAPARSRVSPVFAVVVLAVAAGLAWWAWYELIRSPYLTHGYMTLELQFRLPSGMALPADVSDVHIAVQEGEQGAVVVLGAGWHGTDGDRRVILASATLSRKTSRRLVSLELPGVAEQTWLLDLSSDPDPTPGYSPWRTSNSASGPKIEMNFRLSADR